MGDLRAEIAAATSTLLAITCTTRVPADQETADHTGRRFIRPEARRREEHDAMNTDDASTVLATPSRDELDRLLHLAQNPTGRVIEDPIDVLRTRTVLKVAEYADLLRIGRSTAYATIKRGDVEIMRVGADDRGIRVLAQPLARRLGDTCPHCGAGA